MSDEDVTGEPSVTNELSNLNVSNVDAPYEPTPTPETAPKQGRNTFSIALLSIGVLAVLAIALWAYTARGKGDPGIAANAANSQSTAIPTTQAANDVAQTPQAEAPPSNEPPFIEPKEVLDMYTAKNVFIVDVRSSEAYLASHVKDAVSIPESEVATRMTEFPKTGNLVLYCT